MAQRWRIVRETDDPEPSGAPAATAPGLGELLSAMAKPFYLVEELARLLRITPRGVRKMMDRNELPWALLGRQRVVPRAMLDRQLAEQAQRNAEELRR